MEQSVLLLDLTKKLLNYTDDCSKTFEKSKESQQKGDFYTEVKPFADDVKAVNERWRPLALTWIRENKPKHLHEKQIESASEQMELLSVQAFFPDTSRTRFINYLQSVRFIFTTLIECLEQ